MFERKGTAPSAARMHGCRIVVSMVLLAVAAALHAAPQPTAGERAAQARLESVRAQIRALAIEQQRVDDQRSAANDELRQADRQIADASAAIRALDDERRLNEAAVADLRQQRDAVQQQLLAQRDRLAGLLRSAYALGRHEQLKLLLAPADSTRSGRALAYQRYLQRDRLRRIDDLLGQLAELARLGQAIELAQRRLTATLLDRQQALTALQQQRERQQQLVAELDARFHDSQQRIAALGRDEATLLKLIESLKDVFADIPRQLDGGQPLAQQRGRLPRPATGPVATAFGGRLPDGRRSNGWWIAAGSGAPVHAVGHGRVAFADWMKGYGLLLIVDHGDGFMSLYAANEALLKDVGDWVQPGEAIATVGSSGGQARPGVYFELRQGGRPVDPARWLRR